MTRGTISRPYRFDSGITPMKGEDKIRESTAFIRGDTI